MSQSETLEIVLTIGFGILLMALPLGMTLFENKALYLIPLYIGIAGFCVIVCALALLGISYLKRNRNVVN